MLSAICPTVESYKPLHACQGKNWSLHAVFRSLEVLCSPSLWCSTVRNIFGAEFYNSLSPYVLGLRMGSTTLNDIGSSSQKRNTKWNYINCEHRGNDVPRGRVLGEQEMFCLDFGIKYLFCVPMDAVKQKEMKLTVNIAEMASNDIKI